MTGIASAANSLLLGHIAGGTTTFRVGSGGVMLPNQSPLVIAEQFFILETLYPGRGSRFGYRSAHHAGTTPLSCE